MEKRAPKPHAPPTVEPPKTEPSEPGYGDIRHIGFNDPITGLPSNRALGEAIEARIARWAEGDPPIVYLGADLERIGDITSAFGPRVRAALLQEVARRLGEALPASATLFHVYSTLFGVVHDGAHYQQAVDIARRFSEIFQEPFEVNGIPIAVQAHIGLASYPNHASDGETLRQTASDALREARDNRLPYAIYNPRRHEEQRFNMALLSELRGAIAAEQFELFYQPLIDLRRGRCAQMEALIRWRHPAHGYIPPGRFIPAAEATLLIRELTAWVARSAIEQIGTWRAHGLDLGVSINLSARDLGNRDFDAMIPDLLNYYGVESEKIAFEVTESALMQTPESALASLAALRRLGSAISIDDFGQTYSSLTYLAQLPATTLKIDQSFALNLARAPKNETIIRAAVALAHDLELETVLEGVETASLYDAAKRFGSDGAQGYFIARPMPADSVPGWLSASPYAAR